MLTVSTIVELKTQDESIAGLHATRTLPNSVVRTKRAIKLNASTCCGYFT